MMSERYDLGKAISMMMLIFSFTLALLPILGMPLEEDIFFLLTGLSSIIILTGVWNWWRGARRGYLLSLGAQMAWSLSVLGLLGASLPFLWALLFLQLAIILTGDQGEWLHSRLPADGKMAKLSNEALLRHLLSTYLGLGAVAAISFVALLVSPLLGMGGNIVLVVLFSFLAIISFAVLASRAMSS